MSCSKHADYHVHPGYSIDAAPESIEQYCLRGLQLELSELCFTPHFEVDPVRKNVDWFVRVAGEVKKMDELHWLERFFSEIEAAQKKFQPTIKIKAGIEIGYEPGCEKNIERVLAGFPFDFVLGSIHCLNHIAISSKKESPCYFTGKTPQQIALEYFSMLEQAVKTCLFDCIAHVDLYRRYGWLYLGESIHDIHLGYLECIENIFSYMAKKKIALEINTSGLRRGLNDINPSQDILSIAVRSGINLYTTGSDAHSVKELGQGLHQAEELLTKFLCHKATYTRRKPDQF